MAGNPHTRGRRAGATFPDSPTPGDGCDVAGGAGTQARLQDAPAGVGLYLLLVAVDSTGAEGPYGKHLSGLDRHDPAVDPRGPGFFCP